MELELHNGQADTAGLLCPRPAVLVVAGGWAATGFPCQLASCEVSTGRWYSGAALEEPRHAASAAAINGRVYIVGGYGLSNRLSSVVVYDVATGSMTMGPALRTARSLLGVAALGDVLYAAGGRDVDGESLCSAEALDPREGVWRSIADMSSGRAGVGVAALNGLLYAVGGDDGNQSLDSVDRYDPAAGIWRAVESMTVRRGNAAVGVLEDKMYVVGGCRTTPVSSMEQYREGTGWAAAPDMPAMRAGAAATAHGGRLYVVGGRDVLGDSVSTVAVFEGATGEWSELPSAMPEPRSDAAAVMVDCTPAIP